MRGKLKDLFGNAWNAGLIPAHAGKTPGWWGGGLFWGAHPRACGENWCLKHAAELVPGSSPRMRGKREGEQRAILLLRLIPAHAGKTFEVNGAVV